MKPTLFLLLIAPVCAFSQTLSVHTHYNAANKSISVVNALTGDTIQAPNLQPAWVVSSGTVHPSLVTPVITVDTVYNGYDITYTFQNTTTDTSAIGVFYMGGFRFDSLLYVRDFYNDGDEDTLNHHNNNYFGGGNVYPRTMYSPTSVLGNDIYTVGISFKYPVTQYKHEVFMRTESPGGIYSVPLRNWQVAIQTNKAANGMTYFSDGDLQPNETRIYQVSVRFNYRNDNCHPWLTTLEPYKKYFNQLYGNVTYTRETEPIAGYLPAIGALLNASNPYGFRSDIFPRPDIAGFGPLAHHLISLQNNGYHKMLLWTPTGYYKNFPAENYTFKFTSHWQEGDTALYPNSYGHNMADATDSLQLVPQSGNKLGLWWGRATGVMTDWDTTDAEVLNPYNPVHINKAFHELDLALQAGASFIGLDAFTRDMPIWDAYLWIQQLRQHAPNMKFGVEQGSADILHTKATSVYYSERLSNPHYLANYLLKGNEIWAIIRAGLHAGTCIDEIHRLSDLGYVSINLSCNLPLSSPYLATESWYQTNPYPDLGFDTTITAGDTLILNAAYENAASYNWSTGETSNVIMVTTPGTYIVHTTNTSGCSFSDTIVVTMIITGLHPNLLQENELFIYPNPTSTQITIRLATVNDNKHKHTTMNIYDVTGKAILHAVLETQQSTLDVSFLPTGIYIIKIQTENSVYSRKFIKQ